MQKRLTLVFLPKANSTVYPRATRKIAQWRIFCCPWFLERLGFCGVCQGQVIAFMEILLDSDSKQVKGIWQCIIMSFFWSLRTRDVKECLKIKEEQWICERLKIFACCWISLMPNMKVVMCGFISMNWRELIRGVRNLGEYVVHLFFFK